MNNLGSGVRIEKGQVIAGGPVRVESRTENIPGIGVVTTTRMDFGKPNFDPAKGELGLPESTSEVDLITVYKNDGK